MTNFFSTRSPKRANDPVLQAIVSAFARNRTGTKAKGASVPLGKPKPFEGLKKFVRLFGGRNTKQESWHNLALILPFAPPFGVEQQKVNDWRAYVLKRLKEMLEGHTEENEEEREIRVFNEDNFKALHDETVFDLRRAIHYDLTGLDIFIGELRDIYETVIVDMSTLGSMPPDSPQSLATIETSIYKMPLQSAAYQSLEELKDAYQGIFYNAPTRNLSGSLADRVDEATKHLASKRQIGYALRQYLGKGSSGEVYSVQERFTNRSYALKIAPKAWPGNKAEKKLFREAKTNAKLESCHWVAQLEASWHDDKYFFFLMHLYPSDLQSEITTHGVIDPIRAQFYAAELFLALETIHANGILHRDIKPGNLLITREGHLVLSDFGLAKDFHWEPTPEEMVWQPYWMMPTNDEELVALEKSYPPGPIEDVLTFATNEVVGTRQLMAPEVWLGRPYSFGVDFWSASLCLYYMLTGQLPWDRWEQAEGDAVETLQDKILYHDIRLATTDNVDDIAEDFLYRMLKKHPQERLPINKIWLHPYFEGVDWHKMSHQEVPPPWVPEFEIGHTHKWEGSAASALYPGAPFQDKSDRISHHFNFLSRDKKQHLLDVLSDVKSSKKPSPSTPTSVSLSTEGNYVDAVSSVGSSNMTVGDLGTSVDECDFRVKVLWESSYINKPSNKPSGPGRPHAIFEPYEPVNQSRHHQQRADDDGNANVPPIPASPTPEVVAAPVSPTHPPPTPNRPISPTSIGCLEYTSTTGSIPTSNSTSSSWLSRYRGALKKIKKYFKNSHTLSRFEV